MQITETTLRRIIREELSRINESRPVSNDPFARASGRFLNAVEEKGIDRALNDTMLRVDRLKNPAKARGVVKFLSDFLKSPIEPLTRLQKKIINQIIKNAKAKA
ncbi:unnamed protein product [marine sediment metagenome]|uniref:Uncharacterized protein n=1 Tax=marine sediment metagenome TaxID=412755 RepID=X0USC6_9ZZZZ